MNNHLNQDNLLLNQSTQQQYPNIQLNESQVGKTQKMIDFQYTNDCQDSQKRSKFVKKMYIFLTLEFFFTFEMIFQAFSQICNIGCQLLHLLVTLQHQESFKGFNTNMVILFFYSNFINILIHSIFWRKKYKKQLCFLFFLILYLIFYGFVSTTICIYMFNLGAAKIVLLLWGITLTQILTQTCYFNIDQVDISFPVIYYSIIFSHNFFNLFHLFYDDILSMFINNLYIGECFLWNLLVQFTHFIQCRKQSQLCAKELLFIKYNQTLKLQPSDSLVGSLLLYALMIQPIVRICNIIYNAIGRYRK